MFNSVVPGAAEIYIRSGFSRARNRLTGHQEEGTGKRHAQIRQVTSNESILHIKKRD